MAITSKKDSFYWVVKFHGKQIWTLTPARTIREAQQIERECLVALRSTDYSSLSIGARETLVRYYAKAGLEFPAGLRLDERTESREFVLYDEPDEGENRFSWGAIQLFMAHPSIRRKEQSTRDRYDYAIAHLVKVFGPDFKMKELWVNEISSYYDQRRDEGAAPATINWEISTLSNIFQVLIASKQKTGIRDNPCQQVRGGALGLKLTSRKRQAYLSWDLVNAITTIWNRNSRRPLCPDWLALMILTSYWTGMRLNEVVKIKRHQIDLHKRMIFLTTLDQPIKEGEPKRVPIHKELIPVLEKALKVRAFGHDNVFLLTDRRGTRPPTKNSVELAMRRIVKNLNPEPRFSFHDLRHTFKANCRRSGIPEVISERICGHADADGYLDGELPVSQRYGAISDQEFIKWIDILTINHGDSMIDGKPVYLLGNTPNRDCQSIPAPGNHDSGEMKRAIGKA